jgi:hypothetical protein
MRVQQHTQKAGTYQVARMKKITVMQIYQAQPNHKEQET